MAKLSAYGRTEIARVERGERDNEEGRHTKVLLSDGTILQKRDWKTHSTGWKRSGRVKPEFTERSAWLAFWLQHGFKEVTHTHWGLK